MNGPLFRRRTLVALICVTVGSFAASVVLGILGPGAGSSPHAAAPTPRSTGATGFRALAELLRSLGIDVDESARPLGLGAPPSLVVLLEPEPGDDDLPIQGLEAAIKAAPAVLLVLPKWRGEPDPGNRAFLRRATRRDADDPAGVLAAAGIEGDVVQKHETGPWLTSLGAAPALEEPQLAVTVDLDPLVSSSGRILVGERRRAGRRLAVLTDPDVLANHGLHRGDNALLAVALIERLRIGPGPVVLDTSLQPRPAQPSVWRSLLEVPLVFATLQSVLAALVVVWAGMGRFGPPAPLPPPLPAGNAGLIESTAALLRSGGHSAHALQRYFAAALQDVAIRLRAPPELRGRDLTGWLDRVAAARGVPVRAAELGAQVEHAARFRSRGLMEAARDVHRWRTGMLHGSE